MINEYEYEYHDVAEDADFIEENNDENECYYDDGTDEPWCGVDENDEEIMDEKGWENYYHNIADEIDED